MNMNNVSATNEATLPATPTPTATRIGIVVSRFNQHVTSRLLAGAMRFLEKHGIPEAQVQVISVPGAVEIPLMVQQLAKAGAVRAVIAIGAVIRGETGHYDYVCEQVSHGCQHVSLKYDIPVAFGVITTDTMEQAMARAGGAVGNKGAEAAEVALEMVGWMDKSARDAFSEEQ